MTPIDVPEAHAIELLFYTTDGCHLCEEAETLLLQLLAADPNRCTVEVIDIIESDDLVERYGERIPVVKRADTDQELGWPFDLAALRGIL